MSLKVLQPLINLIPEIETPKEKPALKQKLIWTLFALLVFAILGIIVPIGIGQMGQSGYFSLAVQPGLRSVRSRAEVPWQWPSGLGALMGGGLNLSLKSSSLFRLEEFWPGPPGKFE